MVNLKGIAEDIRFAYYHRKFWKEPKFQYWWICNYRKFKRYDEKTRKFIDKFLLGRYFKIAVQGIFPIVLKLLKWSFIIMLNGSLIYTAYLGIVRPIHYIHTIFALGLALWMPITLVKKAYTQICKDKLERVKAIPHQTILPPMR